MHRVRNTMPAKARRPPRATPRTRAPRRGSRPRLDRQGHHRRGVQVRGRSPIGMSRHHPTEALGAPRPRRPSPRASAAASPRRPRRRPPAAASSRGPRARSSRGRRALSSTRAAASNFRVACSGRWRETALRNRNWKCERDQDAVERSFRVRSRSAGDDLVERDRSSPRRRTPRLQPVASAPVPPPPRPPGTLLAWSGGSYYSVVSFVSA
jgi:hypothetical protein